MSREFDVRPYRPGDEGGIAELLDVVFNGWPHFDIGCTPVDHLIWKLLKNPLRKVLFVVATKGEEIIGCFGTMPQMLKVGEEVFLGGIGMDAAVHPDFRGKGVWKEMDREKKDIEINAGLAIRLALTVSPQLIRHRQHTRDVDVRIPHDLAYYVRISDIKAELQMLGMEDSLTKKYGYSIIKTLNRVRNIFSSLSVEPSSRRDFDIFTISSFDERVSEFWREIKGDFTFIVERTRDYLNWRYCDPRGGSYLLRQAEENGRVIGYSVLRVNRYIREYPVGYIVDLLSIPGRIDVAFYLIADAVKYFERENVKSMRCVVFKTSEYGKLMGGHGFIDSKYRLHFTYQTYAKIDEELKKLHASPSSRMHFGFGNYDAI